jgi:hypothetical protein
MNKDERKELIQEFSQMMTESLNDNFENKVKPFIEKSLDNSFENKVKPHIQEVGDSHYCGFIAVLEKTNDSIAVISEGLLDVKQRLVSVEESVDDLKLGQRRLETRMGVVEENIIEIKQENRFIKAFLIDNLEPRVSALEAKI